MNRLLLVEDDEPTRHLIRTLMTRAGFNITCVADGEEGLRELRRADYDVVLLDLLLPGTNGFEVLREVKCLRPELLPQVIVLTAASSPTIRHCEELQMVRRVMQKPLDIEELLNEVVSATRKSPHASPFADLLQNAG